MLPNLCPVPFEVKGKCMHRDVVVPEYSFYIDFCASLYTQHVDRFGLFQVTLNTQSKQTKSVLDDFCPYLNSKQLFLRDSRDHTYNTKAVNRNLVQWLKIGELKVFFNSIHCNATRCLPLVPGFKTEISPFRA